MLSQSTARLGYNEPYTYFHVMKHTQIHRQECNTVVKSSLKNQNAICVCGHKFKELECGQEYHGSGTEL